MRSADIEQKASKMIIKVAPEDPSLSYLWIQTFQIVFPFIHLWQ